MDDITITAKDMDNTEAQVRVALRNQDDVVATRFGLSVCVFNYKQAGMSHAEVLVQLESDVKSVARADGFGKLDIAGLGITTAGSITQMLRIAESFDDIDQARRAMKRLRQPTGVAGLTDAAYGKKAGVAKAGKADRFGAVCKSADKLSNAQKQRLITRLQSQLDG